MKAALSDVDQKEECEASFNAYEQSLSARLQRVLRLVKTQQITVKASPEECLAWLESLSDHPPDQFQVLLETQTTKRPYQFSAHLTGGYRRLDVGVVIGDITATSSQTNRSVAQLHLYRGFGPIFATMLAVGFGVYMSFQGVSSITNPSRDGSLQCCGVWFGMLAVMSVLAFLWAWYRADALHMFSTHLLKLNSMTE